MTRSPRFRRVVAAIHELNTAERRRLWGWILDTLPFPDQLRRRELSQKKRTHRPNDFTETT